MSAINALGTNASHPTGEGNEVPAPPPEPPASYQPPVDTWENAGSSPDGGVPDGGGDGPTPDAPDGRPAPSPRVPQQVSASIGIDVSVTVVHPALSGGGGTYGVVAGIGMNGPYVAGYNTPPDQGSAGLSVGGTAGVNVTVGFPTSGPSEVVGGSLGPAGASASYTPGTNGGPGAVSGSFGLAAGPPGLFGTQTESTYWLGSGPEPHTAPPSEQGPPPVLDGGQCIEGDLDGDGYLNEEEIGALNSLY